MAQTLRKMYHVVLTLTCLSTLEVVGIIVKYALKKVNISVLNATERYFVLTAVLSITNIQVVVVTSVLLFQIQIKLLINIYLNVLITVKHQHTMPMTMITISLKLMTQGLSLILVIH